MVKQSFVLNNISQEKKFVGKTTLLELPVHSSIEVSKYINVSGDFERYSFGVYVAHSFSPEKQTHIKRRVPIKKTTKCNEYNILLDGIYDLKKVIEYYGNIFLVMKKIDFDRLGDATGKYALYTFDETGLKQVKDSENDGFQTPSFSTDMIISQTQEKIKVAVMLTIVGNAIIQRGVSPGGKIFKLTQKNGTFLGEDLHPNQEKLF